MGLIELSNFRHTIKLKKTLLLQHRTQTKFNVKKWFLKYPRPSGSKSKSIHWLAILTKDPLSKAHPKPPQRSVAFSGAQIRK